MKTFTYKKKRKYANIVLLGKAKCPQVRREGGTVKDMEGSRQRKATLKTMKCRAEG